MHLPKVRTSLQLRFTDIDLLGHVSNAFYPQYFDLGRIDFFMQVGKIEKPPACVVRHVEYDMLGEIKLLDEPVLDTWCSAVGNTSLTIEHAIYVGQKLVVKCKMILVGFDEETRTAKPFPSHWKPTENS